MTYLAETLAGRIVLSIATAPEGDEALFAHLEATERACLTEMLAELHVRKIDLADEVLIVDVGVCRAEHRARTCVRARRESASVSSKMDPR